jgi:hypothetical protein
MQFHWISKSISAKTGIPRALGLLREGQMALD